MGGMNIILGMIALGCALFLYRYLRVMVWPYRKKPPEAVACPKCGYLMEGLKLPRCPECGTLRGFDVPLDRLGVSEDEIRAGSERMAQRRAERDES